jgi:A/G-specific adenine glycosylase
MNLDPKQVSAFRRKVWAFYRANKRSLPFRRTKDPYRILVSEVMSHQTQLERIVPKYKEWTTQWPDWQSLAKATTRELLAAWSGLGYNRRAINLGRTARIIVEEHNGVLPQGPGELTKLPGIGPYTARAVLIFAFNKPLAAIDTNVRRVLIHELNLPVDLSLRELEDIAFRVMPKGRSRDWHHALMDYGALKLPSRKSHVKPLSRQNVFEGSLRQIRGEVIRQLTTKKRVSVETIARVLNRTVVDVDQAIAGLVKDGLVARNGKWIYLA